MNKLNLLQLISETQKIKNPDATTVNTLIGIYQELVLSMSDEISTLTAVNSKWKNRIFKQDCQIVELLAKKKGKRNG